MPKEIKKQTQNQSNGLEPQPKVDKKTRKYTDPTGQEWQPAYSLLRQFNIPRTEFLGSLQGVQYIEGYDVKGHLRLLYNVQEVSARVGVIDEPVKTDKQGQFVDEEGESWVTVNYLKKRYGYAYATLKQYVAGVESRRGQATNAHLVPLYKESAVRENLDAVNDLPEINKQEKAYQDPEDNTWVTTKYFTETYDVTAKTLKDLLKGVSTKHGRSSNNRVTLMFNLAEAAKRLDEEFSDLPAVDRTTRTYVDDKSTSWMTAKTFSEKYGISYNIVAARLPKISKIAGKDVTNRRAVLCNEEELLREVQKSRKVKEKQLNSLSSAQANTDLDTLLEENNV